MGTINSAFALIASGLDADQSALSIVANNVANANTTGYTREVPDWVENTPIQINGVTYGSGVTETGAKSVRDGVLSERLVQQQQLASASSARMSALNSLQSVFSPDSGSSNATAGDIGSDITAFFDSFSRLEANATDNSLRQQVLSTAATLAGDLSNAAASVAEQQSAIDEEAGGVVNQLNALTSAIGQLNLQIQSVCRGGDAGTLEDQRQQDISQLSQLVGINQVKTENNGFDLTTTSGQLLVSGSASFVVTTGIVGGVTHFFVGGTDMTAQLSTGGGQLGGYLTARDQDLAAARNKLDQLAYGLATAVNAQNNEGLDLKGTEGSGTNGSGVAGAGSSRLYIFAQPTEVAGSASSMRVIMTDPSQIAAAGFGCGTGDNSNAAAIARLANQPLVLPMATTAISLSQNLSSSTPSAPPGNIVSGSVQVYDSLGNTHNLSVTYAHQGVGQWTYAISLQDELKPDTAMAGQVSYTFGLGETVDPVTNLVISGPTGGGVTATIAAPLIPPGEPLGDASTGYVKTLNDQLAAKGIVGVVVANSGGILTITGATATNGNVVANATASPNAVGSLQFNGNGALIAPSANLNDINFSGLSDGAASLDLDWELYSAAGTPNITQTAAASAQTGQSQNGFVLDSQNPIEYYSSFLSDLGSIASQAQIENTAQNASVTQLQTQQNALSAVNLNDEAAAMQQFERSYQAASQVFAILNNIMASALNLGVQTAVS